MAMATRREKVSSYLESELKNDAERLARARQMSLSTLVANLLAREVRLARQDREIAPIEPR